MTEKREIDECSKDMESLDLNSYEMDEEEEESTEIDKESEMWNFYDQLMRERERETKSEENEEVDDNTCYNATVLFFSDDHLSKDEKLCEVWESKVEPLFKRHRLSCRLDWDERKMTVGTRTAIVEDCGILNRGACALALLSRGFSTECLDQIFSRDVHCQYMDLTIPDGMSEDDFSSKYQMFKEKIDKFGLLEKLSCFIIYGEGAIFAYSDKPWSTYTMRNLVNWCLLGNDLFDREHFRELSLDDV